jgi:hypothetical protein
MRLLCCVAFAILLTPFSDCRADDASKPDEEGFIRKWLVLAPFPFADAQDGAGALNKQQLPDESKLQPKAGDKVKSDGHELVWKECRSKDYMLDFNAFLGQETEDSVGYAVSYLICDQEMTHVTMKTGSDDQAKVYLNGKEVLKIEDARSAEKDQDSTPDLTLKKGVNVIVFKIVNEKVDWQGCMRFTDKDDKPITGYKVSTSPQ